MMYVHKFHPQSLVILLLTQHRQTRTCRMMPLRQLRRLASPLSQQQATTRAVTPVRCHLPVPRVPSQLAPLPIQMPWPACPTSGAASACLPLVRHHLFSKRRSCLSAACLYPCADCQQTSNRDQSMHMAPAIDANTHSSGQGRQNHLAHYCSCMQAHTLPAHPGRVTRRSLGCLAPPWQLRMWLVLPPCISR